MKVRTINRNRSYITKGKRPINTINENGRTLSGSVDTLAQNLSELRDRVTRLEQQAEPELAAHRGRGVLRQVGNGHAVEFAIGGGEVGADGFDVAPHLAGVGGLGGEEVGELYRFRALDAPRSDARPADQQRHADIRKDVFHVFERLQAHDRRVVERRDAHTGLLHRDPLARADHGDGREHAVLPSGDTSAVVLTGVGGSFALALRLASPFSIRGT